jgi:hypothetical protein
MGAEITTVWLFVGSPRISALEGKLPPPSSKGLDDEFTDTQYNQRECSYLYCQGRCFVELLSEDLCIEITSTYYHQGVHVNGSGMSVVLCLFISICSNRQWQSPFVNDLASR